MKKNIGKNVLLILGLAMGNMQPGFAQQGDDENITWSTKGITWDDFKGPHNKKSHGVASTYSYMDVDIVKVYADSVMLDLRAVFSPSDSWVIYRNKEILQHENGHFNITELYARKLRKIFTSREFDKTGYKTELRALYHKVDTEMDEYHDLYDNKTESSMNGKMQRLWEASIQEQLKEYSGFTKTRITVKLK